MLTMTGAQNFVEVHPDEAAALKSFGGPHANDQDDHGRGTQLDGDLLAVLEALYHEVTAKLDLERTFEDMIREIDTCDQMTDEERRAYLVESLFLNTVTYENERLRATCARLGRDESRSERRARTLTCRRVATSPTPLAAHVPEPSRDPLHVLLAVDHARHALRRAHRLRLRGPVRASACSATPGTRRSPRSGTGPIVRRAARRHQRAAARRFCGDCPLKLPLADGEAPPQRALDAPAAVAALHRVHGRLQHLVLPVLLRARDRHHAHAPGGHARLRPVPARRRRGRAALGRIDFFNYGEAFLHKRAVEMCEYIKTRFPHIYLYTSTNGLALNRGQRAAARPLGHRRSDVLDRWRHARTPTRATGSGATSTWRSPTCGAGRREAAHGARRAVHQLALHPVHLERQRSGDGSRAGDGRRDRRRSPCWEITDHPEDGFSRGSPGTPAYAPSATRSGTSAALATRSPGPRRGPRSRCAPAAWGRSSARPATVRVATRVHNLCQRAVPCAGRYGRRLVRLGAQLCAETDRHRPRPRPRVAAGRRPRRRSTEVAIEVPSPATPGPLPAEVRSGLRGHRLVRGLGLRGDGARPRRALRLTARCRLSAGMVSVLGESPGGVVRSPAPLAACGSTGAVVHQAAEELPREVAVQSRSPRFDGLARCRCFSSPWWLSAGSTPLAVGPTG